MKPLDYRDVDPREIRVPPSRPQGADPLKLRQQLFEFGGDFDGMPPPILSEDASGVLMILNGTTRHPLGDAASRSAVTSASHRTISRPV